MKKEWKITYFKPDRAGVWITGQEAAFAAEGVSGSECGVILYDKKGVPKRFPFSEEGKSGTLYGIKIEKENITDYTYNYYSKERIETDPYAQGVTGLEKWGTGTAQKRQTYGQLYHDDFDWQGDTPPNIFVKDLIIYGLNVRAFTMSKNSGVKQRGTFEGLIEKIPYLKELGINAVELMPCYEYDECMIPEEGRTETLPAMTKAPFSQGKSVVNCWGFQKGFYFAPKAAYSACAAPQLSFKNMVKELHKQGIEVMMQFYFPPQIRQLSMLDVIKFWVREYHIDGIRISGFHLPYRLLAEEPTLKNIKIRCAYLPKEELDGLEDPALQHFLADNGNYRNDMRRYLKGDEGLMNQVLSYQKRNPKEYSVVNYLADYDGFSLYDCVSYERKHNEENGENNRDGTETNFTWNCGIEGESRRKNIQELRRKQIKNALSFLFTAQGIPFLFSGDEFANSRGGNNNCYCQDNEQGWVSWKETRFSAEIREFTKLLIGLRKQYRLLHGKEELQGMDVKGCGHPDISYHGVEAWKPDLSYISHMVGIVLNGQYAPDGQKVSFYIAYNMHWESHKMALPAFSKEEEWIKVADTSLPAALAEADAEAAHSGFILIAGRSVVIYRTRPKKKKISVKKKEKDG